MALYDRLIGAAAPKIPVHAFMAALGELERGKMTTQQVIDMFALTAPEQAEATTLIARVVPPLESISMGGFQTLTNIGATYDAVAATVGLGFANIEFAGITGFEFRVGMNRNGAAGTISWQLWDDTTSAQIAVITDTTGAGNKFVSTSATVAAQAAGLHVLRVRAQSSTAADDPLYFGASLTLRRVGIMTSDVLHQVLLLAEQGLAPYNSAAAIQTRLGV